MITTHLPRSGRSSVSSNYAENTNSGNGNAFSAAAERRRAALATFKSQVGQSSKNNNNNSVTPTPANNQQKTQRYVGRPRAMSMLDLTLHMQASKK